MEKQIRFIDSRYKELFKLPDGGNIILTDHFGESKTRACKYLDPFHMQVKSAYHMCEFAEIKERNGSVFGPEGGFCNRYEIYQIIDKLSVYRYCPYEEAKARFKRADYTRMYWGVLAQGVTLDAIYEKHNHDRRPLADKMRSLSMSDVIVLNRDGVETAFYVDHAGFTEVPKFLETRIPEFCYYVTQSYGTLEKIKRGERFSLVSEYNTGDRDTNLILAEQKNKELGVTATQAHGMLCGLFFGWDHHMAEPSRKPANDQSKQIPTSRRDKVKAEIPREGR